MTFDRSSIEHLTRAGKRIETLRTTIRDTEEQIAHRMGVAVRFGTMSYDEACQVIAEVKRYLEPGWMKRWEEHSGLPIAKMNHAISADGRLDPRFERNETWGWSGTYSHDGYPSKTSFPRPAKGVSVVYILFAGDGTPLYVGSTHVFAERVKRHYIDGKPVKFWQAYLCSDREAAYQMEDRLLKEHMPVMNRKAGR